MHILVCVKQTPDSASVYIDPINGQVDIERFVQILNPADACATEAAVRLREVLGGIVTALTLGPQDTNGALRAALAIGANHAIRLWHPQAGEWDELTVAAALAAYIQREMPTPDLILCGDASNDWASGIVGPAIAQYLDLPQATNIAQLKAAAEHNKVTLLLTRKLEHGYRELLEAETPLLITVTGELNEPRYPSLPAHLAALKARIPVYDPYQWLDNTGQNETEPTTLIEIQTPRPLPRHIGTPNSKHSSYERIGEIITGGTTGRKTQLIEGPPEELAQALVDFLKDKGFV